MKLLKWEAYAGLAEPIGVTRDGIWVAVGTPIQIRQLYECTKKFMQIINNRHENQRIKNTTRVKEASQISKQIEYKWLL